MKGVFDYCPEGINEKHIGWNSFLLLWKSKKALSDVVNLDDEPVARERLREKELEAATN